MKVLFVCYANVGRSQVSQVYFSQLSRHESSSAGMGVDAAIARSNAPGRRLADTANPRSARFIQAEFGVDIFQRERVQLTSQLIDNADLAIIIHEKKDWPDYLQESDKVIFWDIEDTPGVDDNGAHDIWRRVKLRVEELVREIG